MTGAARWPAGVMTTSSRLCCRPPPRASCSSPHPGASHRSARPPLEGPSRVRPSASRMRPKPTVSWSRSRPAWSSLTRRPGASRDPHARLLRRARVHAAAGPRPGGRARRRRLPDRPVPAGRGGRVRPRRRRVGRGAGADQGPRRDPAAVRPAAGRLPGGRPADRRRLHRVPHPAPGHAVGLLAAERRSRPGRRPRRGGYWCAEQARRAVRTCHHLHGGIGMDITYPLHRFSALVSDLVRFLGGAEYRLERMLPVERHVHRPDRGAARAARRAARLLRRPAAAGRARRAAHRAARRRLPRRGPPDGPRRLARGRLAAPVRRARIRPGRAADLRERGGPRRRPAARRHPADRRPDAAGARHARQKEFFLPPILAGEVHFAIGYTEPEAGTDLAALRTRAVR